MIETLMQVAIKEVEERSFELTKQYLSNNKLVYIDGVPSIEDVIVDDENQTADVYFPVDNEDYYFVIYLSASPKISVRFVGISAGNRVYFTATSELVDLESLLNGIKVVPTKTWQKGTRISSRNNERFYEDSGVIFEPQKKKTGDLEVKLVDLLDKLEAADMNEIINTDEIVKVIQIVYYGYKEQMWGINLDPKIIERLSKINAYLDIDLYASGPDLE
jgi:hypothetical protein